MSKLWIRYTEKDWNNERYQTAMDTLILEADVNVNRPIDMEEFRHGRVHPRAALEAPVVR